MRDRIWLLRRRVKYARYYRSREGWRWWDCWFYAGVAQRILLAQHDAEVAA